MTAVLPDRERWSTLARSIEVPARAWSDARDGATFAAVSPRDGATLAQVARGDAADIDARCCRC